MTVNCSPPAYTSTDTPKERADGVAAAMTLEPSSEPTLRVGIAASRTHGREVAATTTPTVLVTPTAAWRPRPTCVTVIRAPSGQGSGAAPARPRPTPTLPRTATPGALAGPEGLGTTFLSPILATLDPDTSLQRVALPLVFRDAAWSEGRREAAATVVPSGTIASQPTPDGVERAVTVPILMYHHVDGPQPAWDSIRRGLTVSPESFRRQMEYLRDGGYESVGLDDLLAYLAVGEPLPERSVIITFDDGYRDNYTNAFPVLKEFGFEATFFLVTAPIDQGSIDYLSWDEVREMHKAGMSFGGHSYTHPDLRGKSIEYLTWQIVGNREAIEKRIGEPVRFFSYPSGKYDEGVMALLKSAHFWGAVSTRFGCRHSQADVWDLSRVRITPRDDLADFVTKLAACASH